MNQKIKNLKEQLVSYRLFLPSLSKPKAPGRRARVLIFQKKRHCSLTLSIRKFRTNEAKRSKAQRQLVLKVYFLPTKEISVKWWVSKRYQLNIAKKFSRYQKPSLAAAMMATGLIGITFFSLSLTTPQKLEPRVSSVISPTVHAAPRPVSLKPSQPTSIKIEKVGIDAPITAVDLNSDGSLAVPSDPSATGWYDKSPTPGEIGPAVIDGHVDYINDIAVFWRLREITPGDIIEIDRADNSKVKFVVNDLKQFPQDNFPTNEVYGNIGYAGLRLITCGGVFNTSTRHYSDNTVVFATMQP